MTTQLLVDRAELEEAFADAVSAAQMIGYATSAIERSSHRESLRKAKEAFEAILSRATPSTQVVTDEDVERAFQAAISIAPIATDKRAIKAALESFVKREGA